MTTPLAYTKSSEEIVPYMDSVKRYGRISKEKELELAKIIEENSDPQKVQSAKNEMVLANLRLVVKIAMDIYKRSNFCNNGLMDLINEGNIGLMEAVDHYDYHRGAFVTYAFYRIQKNMYRALRAESFVRLPQHHYFLLRKMAELKKAGIKDDTEIKEALGISNELLEILKKSPLFKIQALEDMTNEKVDPCWQEILPNEECQRHSIQDFIIQHIDKLPKRQREIIWLLYFGDDQNYQTIGKHFNLSREYIRQLVIKAHMKLRSSISKELDFENPNDAARYIRKNIL